MWMAFGFRREGHRKRSCRGRTTGVKVEQDPHGLTVEPIRDADVMCVHMTLKQGQCTLSIALEPEAREVAQQGTPGHRVITHGGWADRDACLRPFDQIDVPPGHRVHKQAGHDALRQDP